MNCKKKIPCPMGGMECCIGCKYKGCAERCRMEIRFGCFIERHIPEIKLTAITFIILLILLVLVRLNDMEQEHNAILDRLDQVENTLTEQINEKFPAEEFTDTEENLGGEFKSWMSFQTTIG